MTSAAQQRIEPSAGAGLSAAGEIFLAFAVSVALLVPCVWQDHVYAGDLSSHVYTAWLTGEIERGAVPDLKLVHPWTNVVCDWALQTLMAHVGPAWAERIVTGIAVLIFFWGAFNLIKVVIGRRSWLMTPALGMLAYGLVFQLGFLNFYLATGVCLWVAGLLWQPTWLRATIAVPLVVLALRAHAMPVVWVAAVLAYVHLVRRIPSKLRPAMLLVGLAALFTLQALVMKFVPYRWSFQAVSLGALLGLTGTEQLWLYGAKYLIVAAGVALIWSVLFLERLDQGGMLADPLVHIWILNVCAYALLPDSIQLPQYQHVLAYIPQRLSLFSAVILCAVVGGAHYGRGTTRFSAAIATMFFTFLYLDNRAFSQIENQVKALVETVPPGSRVVAEIGDSNSRLSPLLHVADRACIGRCFSYANYEPATAQFRIRVQGPNPVIAPTMQIVQEIEEGRHTVTQGEAPIYSVCQSTEASHPLVMRRVEVGEKTCSFSLPISPTLWMSPDASAAVSAKE